MSDELESTERSRIIDIIREELTFPVIGEVRAVHTHTGEESVPSNHEVDVGVPPGDDPQSMHPRVPVGVPTSGVVMTPQVGDKVLLTFQRGEGEEPVVTQVFYADAPADRAPEADPDDILIRRGEMEIAIAGDGSTVRLAQRSDGAESPSVVMEVDESGAIRVGDPDGTMKPLVRQGDTVSGSTSDGASFSTTIDNGSADIESS